MVARLGTYGFKGYGLKYVRPLPTKYAQCFTFTGMRDLKARRQSCSWTCTPCRRRVARSAACSWYLRGRGGAIRVACASETLEGAARTSLATSGSLTSGRKDPRGQREYCNNLSYPAGRSLRTKTCSGRARADGGGGRVRHPQMRALMTPHVKESPSPRGWRGRDCKPPPPSSTQSCVADVRGDGVHVRCR